MIYKYNQWLEESEKMEASVEKPEADLTPAEMEAPADEEESEESEPAQPAGDSVESEVAQFQTVDKARKDAIIAFKAKQKEFMAIPVETRKNPQTDDDKQKVQSLKDELIALNTTMKEAEKAFNRFNDEMLGLSPDLEEDELGPEVEP